MLDQWNGNITARYKKIMYHICWIKTYTSDTNIEDFTPENMYDGVNILLSVIYFCTALKLGNKVYIQMITYILMLSHIGH